MIRFHPVGYAAANVESGRRVSEQVDSKEKTFAARAWQARSAPAKDYPASRSHSGRMPTKRATQRVPNNE